MQYLPYNNLFCSGFTEGYMVHDDNNDYYENWNTANGTLPDGEFDEDTMFYYCCRSDGSVYAPIVLPSGQPFQLLLGKYEEQCQAVAGRSCPALHYKPNYNNPHSHVYQPWFTNIPKTTILF